MPGLESLPPHSVARHAKAEFCSDVDLVARMEEIIAPDYENPSPLLQRELNHCNMLYLRSTDNERVASFFLVNEERLCVADVDDPSVYLGLSATSMATKNTGLVRELYRLCAADIRQKERLDGEARVIWATTVTPSSYYGASLYWDIEPLADGSYTPASEMLADAIRMQMKFHREAGDSPFALRGAAGAVRYSAYERDRIQHILSKTGFDLFQKLGIDERCGDRLLIVARSKSEPNV